MIKQWLKKRLARRLEVPGTERGLERLRNQGFVARQVVDVGAYVGDFAELARQLWPAADILCIEPLARPATRLQTRFAGDQRISLVRSLLGATTTDNVVLNVAETASSVLAEHHPPGHQMERLPMTTLDQVSAEHLAGRSIDLLKLDVQGYELEVLRGASQALTNTRCILAEVNLIDIHVGAPLAHQLLAWLADRDFVAFDIIGLTRRPLDQALWQADIVFLREADVLRADHRYQNE